MRYFKILCPFHQETVPSCTIYTEDRRFYCFGCGAHGHVYELLSVLLGAKEAMYCYVKGEWYNMFSTMGYKASRSTVLDVGQEVEWDISHPCLRGVRVSIDTLRDHGCRLLDRALELHGHLVTTLGVTKEVVQYRVGKGEYLFRLGDGPGSGVVLVSPGTTPSSVLVEGILDALRLKELGCDYSLYSLCGIAVNPVRLEVLKTLPNLHLMLDNDSAGSRATQIIKESVPGATVVSYGTDDPQDLDQLPEVLK